MKKFMDENFLLSNDTAVELYHKYAKEMPIIDYHCHLNPQEIYENKQFKNSLEKLLPQKLINIVIEKSKINPESSSGEEVTYTYYVDKSAFKEGDAIVKEGVQGKYIVGESASLEGVYCMNQGYAVFRRIEILDQNEEYAIISKSTSYGLARYDHIVRNADEVKEEDILY